MLGRIKSYDDMLKRIGGASFIAAFVSTLVLSYCDPIFRAAIANNTRTIELGGLTLPLLEAAIPLAASVFARVFTLHDMVSNAIGIRRRFDTKYIIKPILKGVGVDLKPASDAFVAERRHTLMRHLFYKYAENAEDARINREDVAHALDTWGWFWCCIEPPIMLLIGALLCVLNTYYFAGLSLTLLALVLFSLSLYFWEHCKLNATIQVDQILFDKERQIEIRGAFHEISRKGRDCPI